MRSGILVAAVATSMMAALTSAAPVSLGVLGVEVNLGGNSAGGSGDNCAKLCTTKECVVESAAIVSSLNTAVSPCDDFFEFACGGWLKSHPIPESKYSVNQFDALDDKNKAILKSIFESPYTKSASVPAGQEDQDRSNFELVQALYSTCTNDSAMEAAGAAPILELSAELDKQWPNLSVAAGFARRSGIRGLVTVGINPDFVNSSVNSLYVLQRGLSLPSAEYYTDADSLTLLGKAVSSSFSLIFTDLPAGFTSWAQVADRVVALETRLANFTLPPTNDLKKAYHPKKVSDLISATPSFPWLAYLETLFPATEFPGFISPNTQVIDQTPAYFEKLEQFLQTTSLDDLKLYFRWRLVFRYSDSLGPTLREPVASFDRVLQGRTADPPRWDSCLGVLNEYMGMLEGKFYVDAAFSEASRQEVIKQIDGIKKAMVQHVPELTWVDEATRNVALDKLDSIQSKIGYPDFLLDPTALRKRYEGLDLRSTAGYFSNFLALTRWHFSFNQLQRILKPIDRTDWGDDTPQEVNAAYEFLNNDILFPAGILQSPFYRAGLPAYINYGAIGMVVGHEIIHAFDVTGGQFNKNGGLEDWWSNSTRQEFDTRKQCFVNQFGNFSVTGPTGEIVYTNGQLTLGENLADSGGLNRAFQSWKADSTADNSALPGLEAYTPEQLFFMSFAQIWCNAMTPASKVSWLRTDPHAMSKDRVKGATANTPAFKEAFGCKAPSPVCQVW
ncbi:zincin [Gonapodya prolifera JEL478]|uniref:Zincin n=1 Tax=Gonapodya prolifera (strain JEL478) TaxID=1344416 RepID=A0A139A104_GONPJ|nr:zincin [Gonapodya prolifera JEL478]|eukprot:KXS10441.1 zincin [Gonapodya prolifera JEL478]